MAQVTLRKVVKKYDEVLAVRGIDLDITDKEFIVLVGPSGCGKSTTLRMIAGLDRPSSGMVRIRGRDVTWAEPRHRDIAMVFQDYGLYPNMTVFQNIEFPLKVRKLPVPERRRKVLDTAERLGIAELLGRKPGKISGGQRQRVSLARALVRSPHAFLMDEPLSNLDASLRASMRAEIKQLVSALGITTVYVTHDQIEAMTMADRIVVMHDGIIEQIGTPLDLYDRPGNLFVAQFIGSPAMNVFKGAVKGGAVEALGARWPLVAGTGHEGQEVHYGIRPTDLVLASQGIAAKVVVVEPTGAETELLLQIGDQQLVLVMHGRTAAQPDDTVYLSLDAAQAHVFDGASGQRLG